MRVAVLMGGASSEAAISYRSGNAVLAALERCGHHAQALEWTQGIWDQVVSGDYDCAFIALHGRGGEDGQVQGLLECAGLPYTGSGVLGSALAMDKARTKQVWQACALPTPEFEILDAEFSGQAVAARLGLPVVVKPVDEGSSIGVAFAASVAEIEAARDQVLASGSCALAERCIAGGEYTVGILRGRALPAIRLETPRGFYDYTAKYESDDTQYHCPAGLAEDAETALRSLCLDAFNRVGASGWGRVDVMLDDAGKPWLLEVNTVPGMTDHSLVPMAAAQAGLDFDGLVAEILATAGLHGVALGQDGAA